MTTRTIAFDHPSRRLVVALPQTYDEARERYESLVPEVDFARFLCTRRYGPCCTSTSTVRRN